MMMSLALLADYPPKGGSVYVRREVSRQPVCSQVKGQVRVCSFEPAKALVRRLNRYPDRRPSRAV